MHKFILFFIFQLHSTNLYRLCKGCVKNWNTLSSWTRYEFIPVVTFWFNLRNNASISYLKEVTSFRFDRLEFPLKIWANRYICVTHCLGLDLNDQQKRRYFWQWFHIQKNKSKLKCNREKKILWAVLEGYTNSQSADFWNIAKMALFNPCMEFEFFVGKMTSFEVFKNHKVPKAPSKCLSKLINEITYFKNSPQNIFSLLYFNFHLLF